MKTAVKVSQILLVLLVCAFPVVAVTVEQKLTTRYVDTSNCNTPEANSLFTNSDEHVYLWFLLSGTQAGDRARVEWIAPGGTLYRSASWSPLTSGGSRCFYDSLQIADLASQTGQWSIKLYYNDSTLFTLTFTLLTLDHTLSRFVDPNNQCPKPAVADIFANTEARVYVWFKVSGVAVGDRMKAEWYDPAGRLYLSSPWNPLTFSGTACYSGWLPVSGSDAATRLGGWSVRLSYNDTPLFSRGFNLVATRFNSLLAFQVSGNGRFNAGAAPDQQTGLAGANSYGLMFRWPNPPGTSFTTLRIDGSDSIYGKDGTPLETPTNLDAKTNRSRWRIGDIEVTQTLQLAFNSQTGREDVINISYTVRNAGTVSHTVGQRVMIDTDINRNDGVPFRVPGVGIVRREMEFLGANVPDSFQAFFDITDTQRITVSTLKSGGATAPDRLVLAGWPNIFDTAYDYAIDPNFDFTKDSAYAVYWNPQPLAPGQSRTYTTFYGLSALQVNLTPPLALGLSGPAALSIVNGQYSPNPFDVIATVFNNGTAAATNVQLSLNLPTGLSLATGSATRSLGDLAVGQERQVSWSVRADPQSSPATLQYSATTTASNAQTKTVDKQVTIPALCTIPQIVTQPMSQIIESGKPAILSVAANGVGLTYQWYQGPTGVTVSQIPGANSSSYNTGNLTKDSSFWVSIISPCGTKSSNTARITVVTQPAETRLFGHINKDLDTVVLTHGLSNISDLQGVPDSLWTGNLGNENQREAGYLIGQYLNRNGRFGTVNVLQYVWSDGFQVQGVGVPFRDEYVEAQKYARNAGSLLAKKLLAGLGSNYNHKIHFIGHSLGTVVNAYAVNLLFKYSPSIQLAQFTALDRPDHVNKIKSHDRFSAYAFDDFETFYGYHADFFATQFNELTKLPNPKLLVDNYYTRSGLAGVGDWANSPPGGVLNNAFYNHPELINPSEVGSGFFYDECALGGIYCNDHSGVQQWYRFTILPGLFRDPCGLPSWDRSLNPCHTGWYWSLFGDAPNTFPGVSVTQSIPIQSDIPGNLSNFQNIHGCQLQGGNVSLQGSSIVCSESSPAFATVTIGIPDNAKYLSFEYRFLNAGDGDYVVLSLDNTPFWLVSGQSSFGNSFDNSGAVPIRGLTGSRTLTFALYNVGQINAVVEFRNFKTIAVSNPPILNLVTDQSVLLGGSLSFRVAASDPDGDLLTFSLSGAPAGASINASTGDFSWTPSATQIGSFSFKIRATDNSPDKLFSEQIVTVTVTNPQQPNPVPTITSLDPVSATVGGAAFMLTVRGTNFVNGAEVRWNGSTRNTIFVNSTQVMATIAASDIANLGTTGVTVFNPLPGGGVSNSFSFTVNPRSMLVSVSAASFTGSTLAPESIVAAFGISLATSVQVATSVPLPTSLAGTIVRVRDSLGAERLAPLFFVAPSQINYQIPPGTAIGTATVTVSSGDGAISTGVAQIASVAPGLFSVNSSGQGLAAAVALRLRADGSLSYEPITRFDSAQNKIVAVPIDLGPPSDQVFLVLYGTGWRSRSNLSAVTVKIGGADAETLYAGLADGFVGLDQLNVRVPRSLAGRGEVDLVLTVDGKPANIVRASFR